MRVLATVALSATLMVAGPVFAGLKPVVDQKPANETVVSKTSPDGTWPFSLKQEAAESVVYYSI
jgi:hypothetical protein